ncbi:MAG: M14 family zinc carboxypeptidase [Candidatus Sulfopaludibacter sp.]|nr:M14 family zinc carboxypeptidase [Candidatus Sulfopaludibacter sp.]
MPRKSIVALAAIALALACAFAFQAPSPPAPVDRVADPFATGWMVTDTNGDGIADFIAGKIVVPAHASAAENAAAANLAARVGFAATGMTPPVVIAGDSGSGPRIRVGREATAPVALEKEEGGVFFDGGALSVASADDAGLQAAAEAYSARAPYQWRVPAGKLAAIADAVRAAAPGTPVELVGVTYLKGKAGVHRAFLRSSGTIDAAALEKALASPLLTAVHSLAILGGATAVSAKAEPAIPPQASGGTAPGPGAPAADGVAGAAAGAPTRLDLATLFTSRGLFGAAGRIPLPASLNGRLYVPAGAAGTAMANLAARMGMESTGINLPLASPVDGATARDVRLQAVLAGSAALSQEAERKLRAQDTAAAQSETPLAAGEGELRIVDDAFGRRAAVLASGDEAGQASALGLLADRFPNLWEQGKQHLSLEEIRYDLHRFFSQRSSVGQAAAGLYQLDRWMKGIGEGARDMSAELYVDVADPALADFARRQWKTAAFKIGSLHAGTQCCDKDPLLHYRGPNVPFHQAAPTFSEDIVVPWEGRRLTDAVRRAAAKIKPGEDVNLVARVSEGPEERRKLTAEIKDILSKAGADARRLNVEVLCAYKPGYSWLMDEIAPALSGKNVASIRIDFAKNVDPTGVRSMQSEARWVQELYPVDEMLARKLNLPLEKITLNEIEPPAGGATYRVHAWDAAGKEMLTREFTVTTHMQPYNGVIPRYEQVQVDTGWVKLEAAGKAILNERIRTDLEEFWDHYQNQTLPKVFQFVMSQAHGELRSEFSPPFDTIKLDIHMSEPDYSLDLDKERISSLEAVQEDTFYSTETFLSMMGDLETGRPIAYTGRIIPIVHGSEDGKDGRVHIEFYGKQAANPLVRLAWTDAKGERHKQERNIPALTGEFQPRLIQVRAKAGEAGVERLVWSLPADFADDKYDDWLKLEGQDQVDRGIFSVEKASGAVHWLEQMHGAGLYRDDLAYPRLSSMGVEFDLPLEPGDKLDGPAKRVFVNWQVPKPSTQRPQIGDVTRIAAEPIVQWDEPISPAENASILARLAAFPGVSVYWMGRSYLGENIWAADVTLPSPALLRSWPKESTTKAAIVYSGRQHANEVSSTSHILKLAEQLLTESDKHDLLKKVNVVIHPITNPDGAQLAVDLAKITPDNMLHPGYHGSLAADVSAGQTETDPIYPESRTRKQLIDAWLPDAFLNPHGYPSHEWVQPFSEYTGWVQSRQGANSGRAWWIPRGWFTSMGYLRDETHPYSKVVAYAIQDRIVKAERDVPGLLPLEERMNSRYQRFGQRWQPKDMYQPIVDGIRIYMSLKGSGGGGRGGAGGAGGDAGAGGAGTPGSGGVGGLSADVTWDAAYTEAPDETAHGDYMKLMASAGLAFDYVHLRYLAEGDLRVTRTERDAAGGVQWRIERARPILPPGMKPLPAPGASEGQ